MLPAVDPAERGATWGRPAGSSGKNTGASATIRGALRSRRLHPLIAPGIAMGVAVGALTAAAARAQEPAPPAEGPVVQEGGHAEASLPTREQLPSGRVRAETREESQNPLRRSLLLFDQSMTTQTAGVGPTPQSYVPLYELWLSFRPRYSFDEHWSVQGRVDYTKELTNNQRTTSRDEDVFGDIWTDFVYGAKLDSLWRGTRASAGLRALWPTSKVSQANGTYVTLGLRAGAEHRFLLHEDDAAELNDFHVGLGLSYLHPFTTATSPTSYGGFAYTRQDVDGGSFTSDALAGQPLSQHILWVIVDTGLQVTPRLSFTADFIFINQWQYAATGTSISIANGSVTLPPGGGAQFVSSRWLTTQFDYDLFDELSLSLGYYNLTNAVGPDGQPRSVFGPQNIWWSPDARFFFDITANLDVLFDDARGRRYSSKQSQARPHRRAASQLR